MITIIYAVAILFGIWVFIRESMWDVAPSMAYTPMDETGFLGFTPEWSDLVSSTGHKVIWGMKAVTKPDKVYPPVPHDYVKIEKNFGTNGVVYYNKLLNRRCSTFMPRKIAKAPRSGQMIWLSNLVWEEEE